ncbi:hypothetical protein OMK64_06575 [Cellulomonas fimi]|uniref:hypothetical protein n=1 Tax=Cellulomonas fimi TaxID=1708 RepID=UPI00234D12D4|nr:hypothetical protein [Cellulomonas fimi]MDC7121196.1 hypothetical protein [Cellulomonas fimi]
MYQAPEAAQLLAVMEPVETKARIFGDDVEKVAAALERYAEAIAPIEASLECVRTCYFGGAEGTRTPDPLKYRSADGKSCGSRRFSEAFGLTWADAGI